MSSEESDEESVQARAPAPLTTDVLYENTGESDYLSLQACEIAFEPLSDISLLLKCTQLSQLTMISNSLSDFPRSFSFTPIGSTIQVLCIASQCLTRMTFLGQLPHLRELYLYDNAIESIDGLSGCPSIQKLWIHSNRIDRIQNLECLTDLRELWLQGNRISNCKGLSSLVNLQVLNLSGNPISQFSEIEALSSLPALFDVGFADPHFAPCPISHSEGYRSFVVQFLKGVRILDGTLITEEEKNRVEDNYLQTALEFSDRMDELRRTSEAQLAQIDNQIRGFQERSRLMVDSFQSSLQTLEAAIHEGRNAIQSQQARVARKYAMAVKNFKGSCDDVKKAYEEEISYSIKRDKERMRSEELYYKRACKSAETLRQWFKLVYIPHSVKVSEMFEKSPEAKLFASLALDSHSAPQNPDKMTSVSASSNTPSKSPAGGRPPLKLFRCLHIASAPFDAASTKVERVYIPVTRDFMEQVLAAEGRLPAVGSRSLLLFRDAGQAFSSSPVSAAESASALELQDASSLVVAVLVAQFAHPLSVREHGEASAIQISANAEGYLGEHDVCLFGRESTAKILVASHACPSCLRAEFLLLFVPLRALFSGADFEALEVDLLRSSWTSFGSFIGNSNSRAGLINEKLVELERRMLGEYFSFVRQVWDELWDERQMKEVRAREEEMMSLQAQLAILDAELDAERIEQLRLLKQYRHDIHATSASAFVPLPVTPVSTASFSKDSSQYGLPSPSSSGSGSSSAPFEPSNRATSSSRASSSRPASKAAIVRKPKP
eukprot:ANDGO_04201.mRNA.1 Dynein light chain 1